MQYSIIALIDSNSKCYIKHMSLLARDPETANESMGTFQCAINIESGLWTNIGTCHLI